METYSGKVMNTFLRCCEEEIIKPLQGKITGDIPLWVKGTLLRNGPGTIKIGMSQFGHLFDGSALLHRFSINNGTATYQCRFLNSATLRKNRSANRIVVTEFGTKAVPDPCQTIFERIKSAFNIEELISDNAAVSVRPFGDQMYAMTEVATVYRIDPESLNTLERKSLVNSLIVCHTAHPHVMPNGDVYNIGLQVIKGLLKHVIVKFPYSKEGNMFDTVEIVSVVEPRWLFNPAYMHSFGITENYFIMIEQPLSISTLKTLKAVILDLPFSSTLTWNPEYQTQIVLINRNTNVQTRYYTDTFFFMHMINAFESNRKLYVDLCTYKDAKIIDAMYIEAIKNMEGNPDCSQWCHSRPKRIEIPLDAPSHSKVESMLLADVGIEIPAINYVYNGCSYTYMYGIGSDVKESIPEYASAIIKTNTETGEIITWHELDTYPSEPVFVAHPDGKDEDDGVILSVLLWGADDRAVTLLVLNARDLREIGRVHFSTPSQVPKCIHGWFLSE